MIVKRTFDFVFAFLGLLLLSPVLVIFMLLVFFQDKSSPIYKAPRVGLNGKIFTMVKMRSMVVDADRTKVDSTSSDDLRITPIGQTIRKYKLDELMQLWNVFIGEMSLVGPRPNVERDVDLYTQEEKKILTIKPGITDLSSIVFSDEGDILEGSDDPDLLYNQIIRPWKSRLCLLYINHRNLFLDIKLIFWTVRSILSKDQVLGSIHKELIKISDDENLIEICKRDKKLYPYPPPGQDHIVNSRKVIG